MTTSNNLFPRKSFFSFSKVDFTFTVEALVTALDQVSAPNIISWTKDCCQYLTRRI